jgi:hypothetical protein
MNRDTSNQSQKEKLEQRFWSIMEEFDVDNRVVTLLVELFDNELLDLIYDAAGPEPLLLLRPKPRYFDIVEITDPFEANVARHFRAGRVIFVVREHGRDPLEWCFVTDRAIRPLQADPEDPTTWGFDREAFFRKRIPRWRCRRRESYGKQIF